MSYTHKTYCELERELEELSSRLDEMHEIIARKNTIIRLLAMGECTASELGLSDAKELVASS